MSDFTWNDETIAELRRLANEGKSARDIAAIFGCTRNAVIGKAFRLGDVGLHGERKAGPGRTRTVREPRTPRAYKMSPEQRQAISERTRQMWADGRMGRGMGFPHETRVACVAAYMAGVSRPKVAKAMGVSAVVIRVWGGRPEVVSEAAPIAMAALADARARKAEQARLVAKTKAETERARWAYNEPRLETLGARDRVFCERYLQGETLEQIGSSFGLTRERVRQLLARAMVRNGIDFGGRIKGVKGVYIPTGKPPGPTPGTRAKVNDGRKSAKARAAASERMKALWATRGFARVVGAGPA